MRNRLACSSCRRASTPFLDAQTKWPCRQYLMNPYELSVSMQFSVLMLVIALEKRASVDTVEIACRQLPQFVDFDFWLLFQYVQQCPCPVAQIRLMAEIADRLLWSANDVLQLGEFVTYKSTSEEEVLLAVITRNATLTKLNEQFSISFPLIWR